MEDQVGLWTRLWRMILVVNWCLLWAAPFSRRCNSHELHKGGEITVRAEGRQTSRILLSVFSALDCRCADSCLDFHTAVAVRQMNLITPKLLFVRVFCHSNRNELEQVWCQVDRKQSWLRSHFCPTLRDPESDSWAVQCLLICKHIFLHLTFSKTMYSCQVCSYMFISAFFTFTVGIFSPSCI